MQPESIPTLGSYTAPRPGYGSGVHRAPLACAVAVTGWGNAPAAAPRQQGCDDPARWLGRKSHRLHALPPCLFWAEAL